MMISEGNVMNVPKHFEPLIETVEAAEVLGIHPKTLQKMARQGKVPHIRIGRYIKFRLSTLDAWLQGSENCVSQPFRVK